MKKKFSITLMALLLVAALGGCAGGKSSGNESSTAPSATQGTESSVSDQGNGNTEEVKTDSKYGGKVVVGVQQDIDCLDPHKATAAGTKEILFNIFEGLLKTDENGKLIDAVAKSHSISEDGLTYTFTLRDGIKFHNGNPVTV
ncbi:MAG: ABC transporter substrate-binding protein, partial [Lachnospiraceae bacterium]|nr:ABC transporter substrate-binding protein [Lachnospiraceae bacterium]